jgi:4-amino-4-deoxy-L-arabinose transferase-like glycosyltransferase
MAAAMTAVVLCGVGLLLQARQERRPPAWFAFGLYALLGLTLNTLYTVGVLEWELPGGLARMISERPGWA